MSQYSTSGGGSGTLPVGGLTNEILTKASGTNYDTVWTGAINPTSTGLTTPGTGAFTTLAVNGNAKLVSFGSGQLILSNDSGGTLSLLGFGNDGPFIFPSTNTLAQRNGTNGQTYILSRTYTDSSNYSQLSFTVTGTTADFYVQEAGTGVGAITAIRFNKKLNLIGVPTSSSGLSSGDVYSNAGILTIVP